MRCKGDFSYRAVSVRTPVLCLACHKAIAANSLRHKNPCTCGQVATCDTCFQRQHAYRYRQRNKKHIQEYWQDYYYENWQKVQDQKKRYKQAAKQRKQDDD